MENAALESEAFRHHLVRAYGRAHPRIRADGSPAPAGVAEAIMDQAVDAPKALALGGAQHELRVRVAGDARHIYVDLGQASRDAVEIEVDGWRVRNRPFWAAFLR